MKTSSLGRISAAWRM